MNREILNIVNKVLSEEISGRIKKVKGRLFESDKMCSECGSPMTESECMECGYMKESEMDENFDDHYVKKAREEKPFSKKEFKPIPKNAKLDIRNVDRDDSITHRRFIQNKFKDFEDLFGGHEEDKSNFEEELDELGGMDDGHPRFGNKRFPKKMSNDEIDRILSGDENISFEDDDTENLEKIRTGLNLGKRSEYRLCDDCSGEGCPECYGFGTSLKNPETNETEMKEGKKLSKGQKYIAKQAEPKDKIGANDFAKLRSKNKMKESVYGLEIDGKRFIFNESEMVDIIENIVLEEKKKKKKKTTKTKNVTKDSQSKSKKQNDDYIDSVVKKMKDYLKMGSKGDYKMDADHFPKGNGELAKMKKMAYIPSDAVGEYIDNFTAAGLENLDYDAIHPNEDWVDDLTVGSSRTGNNPKWGNAVETPVNTKRNKIRKDNLLAKIKRKAYNKSPQPVLSDKSGEETDKASKIMMKLESENEKKVITDIEKMKNLITYGKKTQ